MPGRDNTGHVSRFFANFAIEMSLRDRIPSWKEYKALLRLGLPVLVTELGVIVVGFADTMMVGAYGTRELAAASFVNNFYMLSVVMLIGFASGVTPLVGALYGKSHNLEIGQLSRMALRLNMGAGIAFTVLMAGIYPFIDYMGQPEELLPLIRDYWLIILTTLVPMSIFNCLQQVANGTTDTASPMWVMLMCNVINILGNYMLIFGNLGMPELGLHGAGIATSIARWSGAVVLSLLMMNKRRYKLYRAGYRQYTRCPGLAVHIFNTSWPVMIQSGIETALWTVGAIVCGWFGKYQLAAYQVIVTISQLGFMTYISFGIAGSISVANCMGRRDFATLRRSVTTTLHINMLLCVVASLIFIFFGKELLCAFTDDPEVISVGLLLIAPLVLYQIADAVQITYANALRGTSHVSPLLWISILAYIVIGIPLLLFFAKGLMWMSLGVYYSFSGALIVAAVLLWRAYRGAVARAER